MKKPDATFVIPAYNAEAYLAEALNSCITQSHKNIEVVVVNDGSTDATKEIAEWYMKKDNRIKLVTLSKNKGRSFSRNAGVVAASSDIIMVLDADDMAEKDRSRRTIQWFKENQSGVFYGSASVVNFLCQERGRFEAEPFNLEDRIKEGVNRIVHSTMAFSRDVWEKVKYPEDPDIQKLGIDDWTFQVSAAISRVKFGHTVRILAAYRFHDEGVTADREKDAVVKAKNAFLKKLGVGCAKVEV